MTIAPIVQERPADDEYFEYYGNYVKEVGADFAGQLVQQIAQLEELVQRIPESESIVLHAPYTWTLRQVAGHLIDAERIFADRMHRIAAGEVHPLPGMDQDSYVNQYDYEAPRFASLIEELVLLRRANIRLIERIPTAAWLKRGVASGHSITPRALAWILVGHIEHHLRIIVERRVARSG
ncbi:MAG: DinB family protein [Planctomycetes bacterium]|nr:DinB family protein [Planctomycetota bacterium]